MKVTWNHDRGEFGTPLTLHDKITIFRERIWGWFLRVAELTINGGQSHDGATRIEPIPHSGFAVLSLTLSYFEMIGKHIEGYTGRGESGKHFRIGFRAVFPELNAVADQTQVGLLLDQMYAGARCGLYHASHAKPGILLGSGFGSAVSFDPVRKVLAINPHLLPVKLVAHLDQYCANLRSGTQPALVAKFEARFDDEIK